MALLFMGGVFAFADDTVDAITAWKRWKSIEAAIALRPLDGPEDIIEKAEIIEDRADELKGEKARLEGEADLNRQKLRTLRSQREVLQDLAEIKPSGDSQTRNRLHDLAERIGREEMLLKMRRQSVDELEEELVQMKELAVEYRERAKILMIQERGAQ
jgi:predicted nuclease with TOPRIM domain